MHLKTLSLRGFKSFASATTLRLEPGITCVVGPNGSGKSNVVDALAWVMGEQGAKSLRGGNMSDVIFAGTSGRAALGRAQVDLTIDNSDGLLPIDYTEVTISRTLFRGGGSEYAINGTPARLLDIQELLSDTGMGRQMHVIVGQGQLDAILSATPDERRGFIEEAAGVLKHRRRKERALKKLADMDANLVRVLDLTQEIHRQLGPLARQAKAARKASIIQARVRDAKARLLADDLVGARDRLASHSANETVLAQRRQRLDDQIRTARAALEELEERERKSLPALERATEQWQELTRLHGRLRGTLMAARERVRNLSSPTGEPHGDDPDELDQRALDAGREDAELLERVEEARTALAEATRAKEEAERADEAAARELSRVNRVIADHRESVARLTGDVSSAQSRLDAAIVEADRAQTASVEAQERLERAKAQAEEAPMPDEADSEAAKAHACAVQARDEARARVDELLGAEREAGARAAHWQARRDALASMLTPADDTAGLLGRDGVIGRVPTLMRVTPGDENAIAAILAHFADAVLVEDLATAIEELERSHREGSGQLRMLIRALSADGDERGSLPQGRWAIDSVAAQDEAAGAIAKILDGVVIVDSLDAAQLLLACEGVRAVATREGDVLSATSASGTGAPSDSMIAIHAQFEEAVAKAEDAEQTMQRLAAGLTDANTVLDGTIRAANEALRDLRAEDAAKAKLAQDAARAQSALQAAQAEAQRAVTNAQRARDQVEWATQRVEAARARFDESAGTAPAEDIDTAQDNAAAAQVRAREAREAETQARLGLRAIEEQSRHIQSRARHLRAQAAREREERQRFAAREAKRLRDLAAAHDAERGAQAAMEAAAVALEEAERNRSRFEAERSRAAELIVDERRRLDECNEALAEVTGESQRDEIARTQLQLRVEEFERRSLEELSIEPDALIEEFGPHNLIPSFPSDPDEEADLETVAPYVRSEQEAALRTATRELERLGRVNPLALEEHDALSKRHEFLVSQVQDLKKSKADLLKIIADVDRLVEEAFTSAFIDTREQFAHTFDVLFPGGKGDLVLTDPDSPLTTGIEIEARPAGKKVKRMSLLSGGERSLAAIAFLVAIFKARPSPFYVMDEVEAALDDVNLSRLLTIFTELREESQLIVITHQKRTMEIADALYGVTMRDGVTAVVSQRLDA